MMKLSLMLDFFRFVDDEYKSDFCNEIASRWDYDEGTLRVFRASANFVCIFKIKGKNHFLRFNRFDERSYELIAEEIKILEYLTKQNLKVNQLVRSKDNNYIEKVDTVLGSFYAVVFIGLVGNQYETSELNLEQFYTWGASLGRLHETLKAYDSEFQRESYNDRLDYVIELINDDLIIKEVKEIRDSLDLLPKNKQNYGLIHYDFELDNLIWNNNEVQVLDFDDSAYYFYVADIAYALRDLFDDFKLNKDARFEAFIKGYTQETKIDYQILNNISLLIRLHNLFMYARLHRSVDINISDTNPKWMNDIINNLTNYMNQIKNHIKESNLNINKKN